MSGRKGPPRRFDWDEARWLRGEGWSVRTLADHFGVSEMAVYYAVDDGARRRMHERSARWSREHGSPFQYDACACGRKKRTVAARCRDCFRAQFERRAVCVRGHAWTPENTYVKTDGSRACRTCQRDARREARRRGRS